MNALHRRAWGSLQKAASVGSRSICRVGPWGALLIWFAATSALADGSFSGAADIGRIFAKWASDTPGCAIGIRGSGNFEYTTAFGSEDLEHGIPNSAGTIFEAGSVSKQFTAAAILMLAREGKLKLEDPVRKYVPELPAYGNEFTIREMLTHTSGLRDWGDVAAIEGWPRGTRDYADSDLLGIVARQKKLNFVPGTRWSYSNTGYNLLEIIVSRVSGLSLAAFTRQRIFLPLGMTHSSWRDDHTRVVPGRAVGYSRGDDGFHSDMPFEDTYGNGGLLTTVGDLLKWNAHLSSPGPADAGWVESQQRTFHLSNGRPTGYGYGLVIQNYKGLKEVSHAGQTAGYSTFLARYPSQQLSIAILCNINEADASEYGHSAVDILVPKAINERSPSDDKVVLSRPQIEQLVGSYRDIVTGLAIKIIDVSGKLHFGDRSIMRPQDATHFAMQDKFAVFDSPGTMTVTDAHGNSDRYERVAPFSSTLTILKGLEGKYTSSEIDNSSVEVRVGSNPDSILLHFGTKTDLTLAAIYKNAFGGPSLTATFSTDKDGRGTALTISTQRVWNLGLRRVDD